ncbi:metallophosphoesterase family protein [Micromonospora haikouensis]|uniref:metallophosphoesterase family protein n=1 Tax=Micromonospora haikouensis TaxID=686309 RepID=UPI003D8C006A
MSPQIMVVGDVHGSYEQLARLVDSRFTIGRHLVFVGDLIDRGPRSSDVLGLVARLGAEWPFGVSVLRGNHEQALLEFLESGNRVTFLRNGGMATVASYYSQAPPNVLRDFRESFPPEHLSLLRASVTHIETREILISHMGYDPRRPDARDLRAMVLEPHYELFQNRLERPAQLTICGHYAQRGGRAFVSQSLICIDTGCGTTEGAPLSAVLLPERLIVQSNAEGGVK